MSVRRALSLWDAVSIIVGIVVGTAIFRSPTTVFQSVSGPIPALGVWLLGGTLCMFGGLCYAELATTYPRNGGDYEYLSRAYGRAAGFLFGWAQLTVVLTGSIGAMAYTFADYGVQLWGLPTSSTAWMACLVIIALSVANVRGLAVGRTLQNVLTIAKVAGLAGVVLAGILWGDASRLAASTPETTAGSGGIGLALVFVLYAFGGWSDASFVAAEVRDPMRNMPRALLLGIAGITLIYMAIVAGYVAVLGFEAARQTSTPAADMVRMTLGNWGSKAISLLVMVSALGAINGMILTGSRVYATVGEDHHFFAWLGRWSRSAAPVAAILVQAGISVILILVVGTVAGRGSLDGFLGWFGLERLPWERYFGGFDTLVAGTAPVFWSFFLMTALSIFVLRFRDGQRHRPFRVPFYPVPPLIFTIMCIYMLYSSMVYARWLSLLGFIPMLLGIPLYGLRARRLVASDPTIVSRPAVHQPYDDPT